MSHPTPLHILLASKAWRAQEFELLARDNTQTSSLCPRATGPPRAQRRPQARAGWRWRLMQSLAPSGPTSLIRRVGRRVVDYTWRLWWLLLLWLAVGEFVGSLNLGREFREIVYLSIILEVDWIFTWLQKSQVAFSFETRYIFFYSDFLRWSYDFSFYLFYHSRKHTCAFSVVQVPPLSPLDLSRPPLPRSHNT
jgi:hypothetical protein